MTDYDGPWKEALERSFELFLAFFFPAVFAAVDWAQDYETLDQELRQLVPEGELGKRVADKLVKVQTVEGDFVYLHLELQNQPEADFARRMYRYNYRAMDRYNQEVVSVAVLGDDDPHWRPEEYLFQRWGCQVRFRFPAVKLLDWTGREGELFAHANPFGLLVVAHLVARRTSREDEERWRVKKRLIESLMSRPLEADDRFHWGRLIDWLLPVPAAVTDAIEQEIRQTREVGAMQTETTFEVMARKRGEEQGLKEGEKLGLEKGIELGLKLKFGAEGLTLMPAVREASLAQLKALLQAVETANSPDELRPLLTSNGPPERGAP